MLEYDTIVKLITILSYGGFFITSITGFIDTGDTHNFTQLMASIVVFISSITLIILECFWYELIDNKHLYYIRCVAVLHYSLLCIGISEAGIGFGIIGMFVSIINLFSGIFMDGDTMIYGIRAEHIDDTEKNESTHS